MQLKRIHDRNNPDLVVFKELYESAFPLQERRYWQDLLALADHPVMQIEVVQVTGAFAGFIVYWPFPDFVYIEHFAIKPEIRGAGVGASLLNQLLVQYDYVVLEAEYASDEASDRRIRFYQRTGFHVAPYSYVQPPYRNGGNGLPMHLLTNQPVLSQSRFNEIVEIIRERVYEANQDKSFQE
ncbi:GNAT family N-acetyltransferase [Segetibacter sp. 3557_3]|uniref:GNAT family N-acetyltransferase n=1 Tax=Segetibacter sp. 3557_3 TaxID=2547429 RepID=UPI00105860A8|nr:GNAT family N-acetyltransferase [Segetibacter sp. 3557_3]TDH29031.1 GNAT family N-acetyltransferase [Segetibacter sp. 3557_3]